MATTIEVLLRRSIDSLGRVGEVVKVRPGYARNHLYPFGLAVPPTKENLRLVEKDKVVEAAEEAERAKQRAELVARMQGASVSIEAKSNPEGHLFGSVGAKQVSEALVAKGFPVEERYVRMEHVKQLGEYDVLVHFAEGAETTVKLWVLDDVTKQASKGVDAAPAEPKAERAPAAKAEKSAKPAKAATADAGEKPSKAAKDEKPAGKGKPAK